MFILVVLLGILSIPRALLKPMGTAAKGELLTSNSRDEESRSKRQTAFFDLLQQTIAKYGNCANECLAPLQALANCPQQCSAPIATCPGATNPHENNPHLKCTKVNLCVLQKPHSHTKPANSWDPRIANDNQNLTPIFRADAPTVSIGSNNYGLKYAPVKISSKYSSGNNFTFFPVNQIILNRLLYRPASGEHKPVLPTSLENTTIVETTTGSGVANATSSVQTNNSLCSEDVKNITQLPLPNELDNATTPGKLENCSCSIAPQTDLTANITTTTTKSVESNHYENKVSYSESTTINTNISLLFQQLDEMSGSVNNDDLKQMLEQLKTYRSAFELDFNETNSTNSNLSSTTATPTRSTRNSIHQMFKEAVQRTQNSEAGDKNIELSNKLKENFKNKKHWHNFNSNQLVNEIGLKPINYSMQSSANVNKNNITLKAIKPYNESQNLQGQTDVKSTFSDLSGGITHTPAALNSQIISNQALQNLRDEMKNLMSSIKNAENNSEQNRFTTRQVNASQNNPTYKNSHQTNKTISNIYDQLNNNNFHTENLNKSSNAKSSLPSKNSSKITISITSNGSFKNIQFEHSDKNFETNEKEHGNMATPHPQTQSLDMMGTGSRHVNIIKQPQMKAPYAEPMLSEMYTSKTNFQTKPPPLTLYWHKVEEKPSKLKRIPSEVVKAFKSFDINHTESSEEESLPIVLRRQ